MLARIKHGEGEETSIPSLLLENMWQVPAG